MGLGASWPHTFFRAMIRFIQGKCSMMCSAELAATQFMIGSSVSSPGSLGW
jgi:hypothetical protein